MCGGVAMLADWVGTAGGVGVPKVPVSVPYTSPVTWSRERPGGSEEPDWTLEIRGTGGLLPTGKVLTSGELK